MNFIFSCSTQYRTSSLHSLVRYWVEHEKIKFTSTSEHALFCLLYKHQWKRCDLLCNHNDGDLFTCEDTKFSRLKAHLVFQWCLYNKNVILIPRTAILNGQRHWSAINSYGQQSGHTDLTLKYVYLSYSSVLSLTHWLLELFAKNAFFGHFGGFEAGSRPN